MRPVSVKELAGLLNHLINEDKGDYIVQVSDDEEQNGYHPLWDKNFPEQGEDVEFVDNDGTWKRRNSILLL